MQNGGLVQLLGARDEQSIVCGFLFDKLLWASLPSALVHGLRGLEALQLGIINFDFLDNAGLLG